MEARIGDGGVDAVLAPADAAGTKFRYLWNHGIGYLPGAPYAPFACGFLPFFLELLVPHAWNLSMARVLRGALPFAFFTLTSSIPVPPPRACRGLHSNIHLL